RHAPARDQRAQRPAQPPHGQEGAATMSPIIGIDLGTTNSCVAVLDEKGQPTTLVAADGERTTPSWVAWSPDETITVGTRARRQAVTNANATVYGAKRLIGRKVNTDDVSWF